MKRDDDLIRALLFKYEAEDDWLLMMPGTTSSSSDKERNERGHILLMMDEGLAAHVAKGSFRLTAAGHDYIDVIRSDTVWNKTKDGAKQVGGVTLGMMLQISKEYLKQEIAATLGVKI